MFKKHAHNHNYHLIQLVSDHKRYVSSTPGSLSFKGSYIFAKEPNSKSKKPKKITQIYQTVLKYRIRCLI